MKTTEALVNAPVNDSDWEGLISEGIAARETGDGVRWALGDIAARAERRYGEESIARLAIEIGIERPVTLYGYWRVSRFYEISTRGDFPALSWSHWRAALAAKTSERAMKLLADASDRNWSVADLDRNLKKLDEPLTIVRITVQTFRSMAVKHGDYDALPGLDDAEFVEVRVYEAVKQQ